VRAEKGERETLRRDRLRGAAGRLLRKWPSALTPTVSSERGAPTHSRLVPRRRWLLSKPKHRRHHQVTPAHAGFFPDVGPAWCAMLRLMAAEGEGYPWCSPRASGAREPSMVGRKEHGFPLADMPSRSRSSSGERSANGGDAHHLAHARAQTPPLVFLAIKNVRAAKS